MSTVATLHDALRVELDSVEVLSYIPASTLDGVAIVYISGDHDSGTGRLQYDSEQMLYWRAPGDDDYGVGVDVSDGGDYLLYAADAIMHIRVSVDADWLPSEGASAPVPVQTPFNNAIAHDDVSAAEAAAGNVTAYTATILNASSGTITGITAWDDSDTALELSSDGATWITATEASPLSLGSLAASASTTLHIRRTISAGASADADVLSSLHIDWTGGLS